jgi:hypothetical protein
MAIDYSLLFSRSVVGRGAITGAALFTGLGEQEMYQRILAAGLAATQIILAQFAKSFLA